MVETLASNILVISKKGKVLGVGKSDVVPEIRELLTDQVGEFIDGLLNERFLGVLSTKENVNLSTVGFEGPGIREYKAIINPIEIAGERLGTGRASPTTSMTSSLANTGRRSSASK